MVACARRKLLGRERQAVFHCWTRCVRRFLCGVDCHTQKDYSHRRDWIVNRWENRFKCRECTDESAVLLCGIYVDLNPFRAGEADAPETARYTSIFQRLQARGCARTPRTGPMPGWEN